MIDMGMREQNSVDVCGIEREVKAVAASGIPTALHQAAVDE